MRLHTISKSPFSNPALTDCLSFCSASDGIVLIEDGVYAAIGDTEAATKLLDSKLPVYAMSIDVEARGLQEKIAPHIELIDDLKLVELCCQYSTVQSWY